MGGAEGVQFLTGPRQVKAGSGARSAAVLHDDAEREYPYGPPQGLVARPTPLAKVRFLVLPDRS